jgi:uncharacterized protein with HEPN domain
MQRSAAERIQDMLEETAFIQSVASRMDREAFLRDPICKRALTRSIEIIGEAAKHVPESARALAPSIPWREITTMRNRIVHDYMGTNYAVVWTTATEDIPRLIEEPNLLLKAIPAED